MSLSFFLGAWPVGVVAGRGLAPPLRNGTRGLLAGVAVRTATLLPRAALGHVALSSTCLWPFARQRAASELGQKRAGRGLTLSVHYILSTVSISSTFPAPWIIPMAIRAGSHPPHHSTAVV